MPAYQGNKPYIFLSFAHIDRELADYVVDYLQKYNFNVWFDKEIPSGTRWEEVIANKIENCWMMVFLATQNSLASEWCGKELGFANAEGKKFINVVIGNPTFPAWFKLSYSSYQFLYEEKFPNRKAMLEKLVEDLLHHAMNTDKPTDTPKDTTKDTPKETSAVKPLPTPKAPEVAKDPKVSTPIPEGSKRSVAPKASPTPRSTEGLRFTFKGNTAKVSGYVGTDTNVIIPATITRDGKTYKVTAISDHVFYGCKNLTSITIPNSVTSIGDHVFYGCENLTSITIPNSVTSIGAEAFEYCKNLTSIDVDKNNTHYKSIDGNLYSKDGTILIKYAMGKTATSFTIPDSVTSIRDHAFYWCSALTAISIPNSVTSIGEWAFARCENLTSITISKGVKSIGSFVFWGCRNLTSISIPKGVKSIGYGAFEGCRNLTSISIPKGVKSIGERAFEWCSSLTSVSIPKGVKSIGESAFEGCSSLTSISIPKGVKSIGYWAFNGCTNLTIYCEAKSKPIIWHAKWNPHNRPVVWGHKIK